MLRPPGVQGVEDLGRERGLPRARLAGEEQLRPGGQGLLDLVAGAHPQRGGTARAETIRAGRGQTDPSGVHAVLANAVRHGRQRCRGRGRFGDLHEVSGGVLARQDPGRPDPDGQAGAQFEQFVDSRAVPDDVVDVFTDPALVLRREEGVGERIRERHRAPDRHEGRPAAGVGAHERVEQRVLTGAAVAEQILFDLRCRGPHHGREQRRRMLGEAADVDDAGDASAERVPDRCPGAGERLEPFVEVLGALDLHGTPGFEHRADAVRADLTLVVVEARCERDVVEQPSDGPGTVEAHQHLRLGVGQGDAHRDVDGLLREPVQDRQRALDQAGGPVDLTREPDLPTGRADARRSGASPRRGHDGRDQRIVRFAGVEESGPGHRHPQPSVRALHRPPRPGVVVMHVTSPG